MSVYSKILELVSGLPRTIDLSTNTLSVQGLQINAATGGTSITHDFNSGGTSYIVTWPASQAASSGYALLNDGAGNLSWAPASAGSVTSVALADGSTSPIYTISGSPVTSSGTLTFTLSSQTANKVLASPNGSSGQPTFRSLVAADIPSLSATYVTQSEVGAVNGVASLDSGGHIPLSQLPASLVEYQGTWAASTNTPTLANGTGTSGWFYIASDSGTVNFGAGGIAFNAGDWVLYNGTIWERAVQSNVVQSVNSQTGIVTINAINQLTGDITAGPASGSASAAATIAAGAVTATKLGTITDGVTLDQSGAGSTLEVKSAGITETQIASTALASSGGLLGGSGTKLGIKIPAASALVANSSGLDVQTDGVTVSVSANKIYVPASGIGTSQLAASSVTAAKLATGAFDQSTIIGGAGTAASVVSSPVQQTSEIAGQAFSATTLYAVRYAKAADSGFVAGRVYSADNDTTSADNFYAIGLVYPAGAVSSAGSITVTESGLINVPSHGFTVGTPVYLSAAGAITGTAPSTSLQAIVKLGMVKDANNIFVQIQTFGVN